MRLRHVTLAAALLCSGAAGFIVSNSGFNGFFIYESVPESLRPIDLLVDTEPVANVGTSPATVAIAQDLMNQWNAVPGAESVFGIATAGGPYNASTAGNTFGVFPDGQFEIAFDETGDVFQFYGLSPGVLGITLKSVDVGSGNLLDFLVVINTSGNALAPPSMAEELFRGTLLHELGHGLGLGHSAVGMSNQSSFGLCRALPEQIPTMFPFRIPQLPAEGRTLEADDCAALATVYPDNGSGFGSISGTVRGLSGAGVNSIAVRAVGPTGGLMDHIGILSNVDGSGTGTFRIPNLEPGAYKVLIEAVNGRGSVTGGTLGSAGSLGANPFLFAADEHWQPGDTFDTGLDDPDDFAWVQVRAGRDTGSVDFVLNADPLPPGQLVAARFEDGDPLVPDVLGGFHYADYYVFDATAGVEITVEVIGVGVVPQARLLRPSDLGVALERLPAGGSTLNINHTPAESGVYTLLVFPRGLTGNAGGSGNYTISLQGAQSVPPPPPVTNARAGAGPNNPGAQQHGSPSCAVAMLQARITAPSHEELWVDSLTLSSLGSGHERLDVTEVCIAHDADGDGTLGPGDPVLATGTFATDNGRIAFGDIGFRMPAGSTADLLVVYEFEVTSVSSVTTASAWWLLPAALLALLFRRRRRWAAVLLLAVCPLACGGGGGAGSCRTPFDPAGAIVNFQAIIEAGNIEASTSTSDPQDPVRLPPSDLVSGQASVSN